LSRAPTEPGETAMTSEQSSELSPARDLSGDMANLAEATTVELEEFSQRLASFGLGETPDPLLTGGTAAAGKSKKRR
jgi:hypothetical protein